MNSLILILYMAGAVAFTVPTAPPAEPPPKATPTPSPSPTPTPAGKAVKA
jgi:hypothetical protein